MDFEIRDIEARRILGVGGTLAQIGELWHRCGMGFHEGWLASSDAEVSAIAYVRPEADGSLRYFAGVPAEASADAPPEAEGFEFVEIAGGRYAFVHHEGSTGQMHDLQVALQAAARAAGEVTDRVELEVYHPTDGDPDAIVDIGARLGGQAPDR